MTDKLSELEKAMRDSIEDPDADNITGAYATQAVDALIAALKAEVERLSKPQSQRESIMRRNAEIDRLESELAQLREVAEKRKIWMQNYAKHDKYCQVITETRMFPYENGTHCTCGLSEAIGGENV